MPWCDMIETDAADSGTEKGMWGKAQPPECAAGAGWGWGL
jgi:hypothetical protein